MNDTKENDTDEFPALSNTPSGQFEASVSSQVQVDLAALSHAGNVRPNNEDHFLTVRFDRSLQTLATNMPEGLVPKQFEDVGYGMLVADGMGGAASGEVASQLAVSMMVNLVLKTPDWIMKGSEPESKRVMERMADRVRQIDTLLQDLADADPSLAGMGTTMTLACSVGREMILVHVGDSRVYLYRDGHLDQLTHDHTVVQRLLESGIIGREAAKTHHSRHVLTRSVGGSGTEVKADCQEVALADRDQVLLCTDGLTDMVDDATIAAILSKSDSVQDACQALIEKALKNGGADNVTVALARYRIPSA
jgi:serine/threonine protein phosphatase PrpC